MAGYSDLVPARTDIDASRGPLVLEFGSNACGICQAAQALISEAFASHSEIRHIKVQDSRGCALGRSFGVKLWPTLICLDDGRELARVVRPASVQAVKDALAAIAAHGQQ